MWGKIMIPMYRLWLHNVYELYGPQCQMSQKGLLNLITHSFTWSLTPTHDMDFSRSNFEIAVFQEHMGHYSEMTKKMIVKAINDDIRKTKNTYVYFSPSGAYPRLLCHQPCWRIDTKQDLLRATYIKDLLGWLLVKCVQGPFSVSCSE